MTANLTRAIREIEQTISSPEINDHLQKIRKYTGDDRETACLLGKFIKTNTGQKLPEDAKKKLIKAIKNNNLEGYFYLKEHPPKNRLDIILLIVLIIAGIPLIYLAISGNFLETLFSVSPGKSPRGGSMPGILFFAALIAAGIRLRYEIQKKKFAAYLDKGQLGEDDIKTG